MNITDSRQINLSPSGATKNNLTFNSDLEFSIPNLIKNQSYIFYITELKLVIVKFHFHFI